jgi:integrase/recombinase XerD
MEYMQSGRKTYTKKKRELITCHSGRRTFISRLIEDGADIHDVMSCTGHKKYDTLKFYVDKFGRERQKRLKSMIDNL